MHDTNRTDGARSANTTRGRTWTVGVWESVKGWVVWTAESHPPPLPRCPLLAVSSSLPPPHLAPLAYRLALYGMSASALTSLLAHALIGPSQLACDASCRGRPSDTAAIVCSAGRRVRDHDGARLPSRPRICTNHTRQPSFPAQLGLLTYAERVRRRLCRDGRGRDTRRCSRFVLLPHHGPADARSSIPGRRGESRTGLWTVSSTPLASSQHLHSHRLRAARRIVRARPRRQVSVRPRRPRTSLTAVGGGRWLGVSTCVFWVSFASVGGGSAAGCAICCLYTG